MCLFVEAIVVKIYTKVKFTLRYAIVTVYATRSEGTREGETLNKTQNNRVTYTVPSYAMLCFDVCVDSAAVQL